MTEPEQPADAPSGSPTPEEISARLEALLRRTHAMREQQKAGSHAPLSITWPPPDRELDHYDVVDVPDDDRMQGAATTPAGPPAPRTSVDAAEPVPPAPLPHRDGASRDSEFARPDWSELRLRSAPDETPPRWRWLPVLTVLLALATAGQAGYLWYLHAGAATPQDGRLQVDGPDGADVRVDGAPIGPAPVEHALEPGDHVVEIARAGAVAHSQRVRIEAGRTVVMVPLDAAARTTPTAGPPAAAQDARPAATGVRPATPAPAPPAAPAAGIAPAAAAAAGLSPTRGAVAIESTPPGLPVTMEGRERGVTPITIGHLKPGRHDVLVGGRARQVDVAANQLATLKVIVP